MLARPLLLAALSAVSRAQVCPPAAGSGCNSNVIMCQCTDSAGTPWDVNALRGLQTTTGPNAAGGDWTYRLNLCGDVDPIAPGCALSAQALREDEAQTVCELLGLPQQSDRPRVTPTVDGISLCFEFGTGANQRSLTVNLVCDGAAGGAGQLGLVGSSGVDVTVNWLTDTVCGGPGPAPEPDPDPDPPPPPEPAPEPDPGVCRTPFPNISVEFGSCSNYYGCCCHRAVVAGSGTRPRAAGA